MALISSKLIWVPLYAFILVMLGIKYKRSLLLIIPIIILTVTASDQLSVHAFKEVFQRLRPCHEPELSGLVHTVNNKCGGLYGFVSSHASNSFAVAVLSLGLLRKKWFTAVILFWAALVSYSRVYLGVHYPGDIIGGALLGTLIAYAFLLLYGFLEDRVIKKPDLSRTEKKTDAAN